MNGTKVIGVGKTGAKGHKGERQNRRGGRRRSGQFVRDALHKC
jgi:hypothetical protein